jgi:hypothetical protein
MVCSSSGCELPRERADADLGAQLHAALVGVGRSNVAWISAL